MHSILECCLYKEARKELKLRLVFLHELTIESLLFGDDTLTELQNLQIFKSVQLYRHGMCFRIIHFILISTVHALFLTCLPVSIFGT